jgi:hypothetical protein
LLLEAYLHLLVEGLKHTYLHITDSLKALSDMLGISLKQESICNAYLFASSIQVTHHLISPVQNKIWNLCFGCSDCPVDNKASYENLTDF